jgi:Domain of unknown function (DUF4111)
MAMSPSTPEPVRTDVAAYLRELTARLSAVLDDRLVAAWLIGSGALDDFDVRRSDIDVQAICAVRPARAELERLAALLSHDALPCPVRGLEFVLYARADLADPLGPAFVLNLNTGGGMRHHVGLDPDAEPRFWFTLDVAIARDHARPLAGAPPAAVVPALPRALIVKALRDAVAWYSAGDGAEAILALSRAWAWAVDGRWLSKGAAATWAAARLEDRSPVERALNRRSDPLAPEPTPGDIAALRKLVEAVLR